MKIESAYYNKMHRMGRWMTFGAIIIFFAVPTIVSLAFNIMPKFSDLVLAAGGLTAIFLPIMVAETIAETPVMGSSYYLTCITGNVLNIKLPATFNALKVSNIKTGTEASDAIIGVAVAVTSLVTMAMLALGVLLLAPLSPILQSDAVMTAANYVLPALFGCMTLSMLSSDVGGGIKIHGRLKAAIIPLILSAILYFFVIPDLYETIEGFVMILFIPIIYFSSKYLYKKGKITVELPDDEAQKM